MPTPAEYSALTAANIQDALGNKLTAGILTVITTDDKDNPITAVAGGAGGPIAAEGEVAITNGALPANTWIADTRYTSPPNICYRLVISDATGVPIWTIRYVQTTSATLDLDTYEPNVAPQAVVQTGPQGLSLVPSGPYNAGTVYDRGAVVSFTDGSSYISLANGNTGNTPNASPTWWMINSLAGVLSGAYTGPLALEQVTVGELTITPMVSQTNGAIYAIADSEGNAALLILGNGQAVLTSLSVNGAVSFTPLPTNPVGAVFGIGDGNGNFSQVVLKDGTTQIATLEVIGNASLPSLEWGAAVQSPLPSNEEGLVGLVVADREGNVAFGIRAVDGKIVGQLADYPVPAPIGKATNLRAGTLTPLFGLNLELVTGESTGSGVNSVPIVSTTQPWQNLMFSAGVRNGSISSYTLTIPPLTGLTSFVPLIQFLELGTGAIAGALFGETALNGICDRMTSDLLTLGTKARFLASDSSLPGAPYSAIAPGTTMFSQFEQIVAAAVSTAGSTYGTVGALSVTVILGINDDVGAGNTGFYADMVAYQTAVQTAIQSATGQSRSVPLVIMQPGRWSVVSPGRAVNGLVTPVVAPQQLQVCLDHPTLFLFSTATYFVPAAPQDGIHFTGPTEQWLGEYYAETKLNFMLGLPSTAVIPKTPLLVNNTIVLPFNVVNGPLVFDTIQVADTASTIPGSMKGFEVWDSTGAVVPILSVAIGADQESVVLQLGSSPVGGSVGYGWSGIPGAFGGPLTGPRGNLRDSNPTPSFYGHPNMYHWAPHFKLTLT